MVAKEVHPFVTVTVLFVTQSERLIIPTPFVNQSFEGVMTQVPVVVKETRLPSERVMNIGVPV